ncbi:hypothetical protein AQJ84_39245 [Streptomyces resistomycificus]|uniref:Uncharacterized protein n=1 Tax=Streptomyces resistomycificus TaxID=67356 RepID=A0A0L8L3S1_9ACTN|nr:hypothetical protein ADK37_25620 [Streptomyces resistomycificus]KUN90677.1 hypothetical protein AQJ84_39245 [Streptomyces resistomycificus]
MWAAITSHVQRSPASGEWSFGRVHPRVCFISRKVCSRSNLLRNACQRTSMPSPVRPVAEDHNQTGSGSSPSGQAVDLESDQRDLNGGEFTGVLDPCGAGGQPRVDAVPGHRAGGAVPVGDLDRRRIRLAPGFRLGKAELLAVLRRSPAVGIGQGVLLGRGRRPSHDAVGAHPSQDLDREAVEEVGHARGVVAGVEDDQDVAVTRVPAAHLDQIHDHPADLSGGDLGDVVVRPETHGVQELAPRRPARFQSATKEYGQPGTN